MSVHKAITQHVNNQNQLIKEFLLLDQEREKRIEEAIHLCISGQEFSTYLINEVTEKMNEISKKIENLPSRKLVTPQMVEDYVKKLKSE
ncbi:DUF2533 family protein [Peribacillus tepidiphilus]|jgi:hypothetical protein|uniref:DUF2533 family protein n=2 Tax=Peribacillus tepidiphilus TaxID=2652445 RepID=UPI0012908E67|nr:DUF2533 family protein [Peribacillus tepidiphilus]